VDAVLDDGALRGADGGEPRDELRGSITSHSVWTWQGQAYRAVEEVHACVGYWVYAAEPTAILIAGSPVEQTSLALTYGWGMCGVGVPRSVPADPRILGAIWLWEAEALRYRSVTELLPGCGYWVNAAEDAVGPLPGR
jgi:hypothetical protein